MSRIGKIPVSVPKDVKVALEGQSVRMEGPHGKLLLNVPHGIKVEQAGEQLLVKRLSDVKQHRASHGTVRARLVSMVEGVTKGHKRELELQGIGFRGLLKGKQVVLNLGLSHPVEFDVPEGVKVSLPNPTSIIFEGPDKESVGQVAARLRALKPAEPYKGKGFRYAGEIIRRKQGKSVTK